MKNVTSITIEVGDDDIMTMIADKIPKEFDGDHTIKSLEVMNGGKLTVVVKIYHSEK